MTHDDVDGDVRRRARYPLEVEVTMEGPRDVDERELRASLKCCQEAIDARRRIGATVPSWLRKHHDVLEAEFLAVSRPRRRTHADAEQSEVSELICAQDAAAILGLSKRQTQRLAMDLDGRLLGGRWIFPRAIVEQWAEGRRG